MRLNVDVIYDNLSRQIPLEIRGEYSDELTLKRPKLYCGENRPFRSDYIYVVTGSRLPVKAMIEPNVVLLCLGEKPSAFYQKQCCCLISTYTDLLSVFDLVQQIFDKYENWERSLLDTLDESNDLQKILDLSFEILENPMYILDRNFYFLAHSQVIDRDERMKSLRPDEDNRCSFGNISFTIDDRKYNKDTRYPFLALDSERQPLALAANVFVKDQNVGCFSINYYLRPFQKSDLAMASFLTHVIEVSFQRNAKLFIEYVNPMQNLLEDILNGIPIEAARMKFLEEKGGTPYVCVKILQSTWSKTRVSAIYVMGQIKSGFPDSICFEHEASIVAFIPLKPWIKVQEMEAHLCEMLKGLLLKGAVSCAFVNLGEAWLYYQQTGIAFEIGSAMEPNQCCYFFRDYKITYLVMHGIGELSLDSLMTPGLRQLVKHDELSSTSYLHTLRKYLRNNLKITQTAQELFIHRSTFLERMQRITTMLDMDLENPDNQLYLNIMLKIMEIQQK